MKYIILIVGCLSFGLLTACGAVYGKFPETGSRTQPSDLKEGGGGGGGC